MCLLTHAGAVLRLWHADYITGWIMGLSKDMDKNAPKRTIPFSLSFVVTHKCNLNCVYCYEKQKDDSCADPALIKSILATYLSDTRLKEVNVDFFGGEPWMEFDLIKDVCEWTWARHWPNKYIFYTTTNGTLVHGEIKEWLRKNKERFWCELSLDGCKETHDKNRSHSFDRIDKDFFLECWPKQTVKMTISKESIYTLFEDIIYVQKLGFRVAGTNFAEGIDWSNKEYVSILCKQLEKLTEFYLANPEMEVAPILNIPIQNCEYEAKARKWCGTGGNMALYDIDGRKYPCQFFAPMTIPNEKFASIKGIDFNDENHFIDKDCFNSCYFYNICSNCYGANFLVHGKLNERDKSKCGLMKVRAYYAAALLANHIAKIQDIKNAPDSKIIALQIRAIEKIKKICEEDLF